MVGGAILSPVLPGAIVVTAVVLGLLLLAVSALWQWEARAAGRRGTEDALERQAPSFLVSQADPTRIGIDAAAQDVLPGGEVPEYVPRDADDDLRSAMRAAFAGTGKWLVVVMGPSKVGKSRAAFEAVRASAPGPSARLVAPVNAAAVTTLATTPDHRGPHDVLWLDDLEPFLNDGLTRATLQAWRERNEGAIVVATYGGKGSERVAGSSGLGSIATQVLAAAVEIPLDATVEHEVSGLAVSSEQAASIARHGLAAYLVAAPELERKLATRRHAPGDAECPEGVAVVHAAVDWARCGRIDAISTDVLRGLWPTYLPPTCEASSESFAVALEWATRPVTGTVSLLQRTGGGHVAFDYVVRTVRDRSSSTPPPEATWEASIEGASDFQALAVAEAAYDHRRLDLTERTLSTAHASAVEDVAALAGYNLGVLLTEVGSLDAAVATYSDVVRRFGEAQNLEVRESVAGALHNRAVVLVEMGLVEAAVETCDEALERFGDASHEVLRTQVAKVLINKAVWLAKLDRIDEALAVSQKVPERFGEEPALLDSVATALFNRAVWLSEMGRSTAAVEVCDQVIERVGGADDSALREPLARAMLKKAVQLGKLGRHDEAVRVNADMLERFVDASEPVLREQVAIAFVNQGIALAELGRLDETITVLDEAVERFGGAPEPELRRQVAKALVGKGVALAAFGRHDRAAQALDEAARRLDGSDDPAVQESLHIARTYLKEG